ncbi:MAG: hypothetical protein B7Y41_13330 [Hydrogenophilales bacterium 28-61-23]|nr:MAG: hypothetical protein B7Y41_13330 [Hydrogenophilales bacterium 28-61-23]
MKALWRIGFLLAGLSCLFGNPVHSAPIDISNFPLFLTNRVNPNVLFDMSIESPMVGAAYNDQPDTASGCTGRPATEAEGASTRNIGTCYFKTRTYLGYFEPTKCYTYSSNRFNPVSGKTYVIGSSATCSGDWSGNLLNWATMTAIDEFRWALTGGHRSSDTSALTVLQRANQTLGKGHSWFPVKKIGAAIAPGNVDTGTVTPYSDAVLYIYSHGVQLDVGTTIAASEKFTNRNARAKVCDTTAGLETNCKAYGTSNKPVGLIQNNADKMRFSLTSYLRDSTQSRDGGVLRSKMKYTGPYKYVIGTGSVANSNKEWSETDGTFFTDPDATESAASGVTNSGIINYINKFGGSGYKDSDPAGELYYEALRYFKNLGRTPEYSSVNTDGTGGIIGSGDAKLDGFPIITTWDDPIQAWCQKNFIVGINDANPWLDKKLPGTYFTCDKAGTTGMPGSFTATDCGPPSNPDGDINVTTLTNTVGTMELLNGATWQNTGTWTSGAASGTNDSVGYFSGDTNPNSCTATKTITNLGEVMGTCPAPQKENSYYIAGLAHYANTQDIRSDLTGKQTIATYMIDTQEYNSNPLDGAKNMLWLTGKYGGFIDSNSDGNPNISSNGSTSSEWDSDGDGVPDNYVLATQPDKLVDGLKNAFADIIKRTGSASSVATSTTELKAGSRYFLAQFASEEWSGTLLSTVLTTGTQEWDAGTVLNSQVSSSTDSRVIITKGIDTVTGLPGGAPFQWSTTALTSAQQSSLNADETGTADARGSNRVGYLRGHSQYEGVAVGTFRTRPTRKLGDIVNASPWYVGAPGAGYSDVDYPSYGTFVSDFKNRFPVVYVGANDGMLHGFNACELPVYSGSPSTLISGQPGCTTALQGKEVLAYVPSKVYSNLSWLMAQAYGSNSNNHKYFVDGSPMVGDAYLSSKTSWRSVLVGGLNSGGKAFYALDVTNPADTTLASKGPVFSETNASSLLLWEFTDTDDSDLGLTYNLPPIDADSSQPKQYIRFKPYTGYPDGRWAVVVGNGYNSTNGYAALYILFLDGPTGTGGAWTLGTDYVKIVAEKSTTGGNGLSSPFPFDSDGDGYVDTIYAGDLHGNMWRFLVGPHATSSLYTGVTSTPSTWTVAFSPSTCAASAPSTCTPLFVAEDGASPTSLRQPIISPPIVTRHPTSGLMVLFGTGQYLSSGDVLSAATQTFYGIQDTDAFVSGRGVLASQTLSTVNPPTITATTHPTLTLPAVEKGWYSDFSISGERITGRPNLIGGLALFDAVTPSTVACTGGVTSRLMALNYSTGAMPTYVTFDTNNDGQINSSDTISAGISTGSSLGGTTFLKGSLTSGASHTWLSSQTTSGGSSGGTSSQGVNSGGSALGNQANTRINWREIIQ